MSDQDFDWVWAQVLADMVMEVRERASIPVIGRITRGTDRASVPTNFGRRGGLMTTLPSGRIALVTPMHHLYVYRQDGQACMILTRVDPFHYEHLSISDLEMETIMRWAKEVANEEIGRFTPADGGWFWWRR